MGCSASAGTRTQVVEFDPVLCKVPREAVKQEEVNQERLETGPEGAADGDVDLTPDGEPDRTAPNDPQEPESEAEVKLQPGNELLQGEVIAPPTDLRVFRSYEEHPVGQQPAGGAPTIRSHRRNARRVREFENEVRMHPHVLFHVVDLKRDRAASRLSRQLHG
eukprot:gb/GFBE01078161.1/.p1 GENE.gb/GFBE01078161.1/~~gb/GFBE01078161.1/.p1  ORF type:complete len:163 (+),score=25.90 gb/GFBE01078161.1/:1-489(+)